MKFSRKQMECLGARLRAIRESRGLSQRDVAAAFGCYPSNVSNIENGVSGLTMPQLAAFARLVGSEPGALITKLFHAMSLPRFGYPLGSKGEAA